MRAMLNDPSQSNDPSCMIGVILRRSPMPTNTDAKEWLDNWVEENLQVPQYYEDKSEMAEDAATCRAAAGVDGISDKALNAAAGGDLERYLLNAQNDFTDAELRRKGRGGKD